ncbi:hypothetical protein V8E54_013169 [Elaphomyces granulatus]
MPRGKGKAQSQPVPALPAADRRIREKDVSHVQKEAAKDSQTSFISQPDDGAMDTRAIDSDFRPSVPRPSGKKRKGDSLSNPSTNRRKTTSGNGQVTGASRPTPFTQEEPAPLSQQGFRHSAPRPTPFVQEEPVRPTPFPRDLPPATAARESSGLGRGPSSLRPAIEPFELAREPSAFPSTRGGSQVPQDDFDRAGTVEPNTSIDLEQAFGKLELYARQWYICTFSNANIDQPIQMAFPGMSANKPTYRKAVSRVRQLYKNFKSRTLNDAEKWFGLWTNSKENAKYLRIKKATKLQLALFEKFEAHHFPAVFSWATRAISFEECSPNGQDFLRYAFVQLVSRARFHALHCQCRTDPKFMKHSREYLLAAIDGLRSKEKWNVLALRDFPLKEQSASAVKNKRFKLDLEEDSDGADYDELLQLQQDNEPVAIESELPQLQRGNEPVAIQSDTEETEEANEEEADEEEEEGTEGTEVEVEVDNMGDGRLAREQ